MIAVYDNGRDKQQYEIGDSYFFALAFKKEHRERGQRYDPQGSRKFNCRGDTEGLISIANGCPYDRTGIVYGYGAP